MGNSMNGCLKAAGLGDHIEARDMLDADGDPRSSLNFDDSPGGGVSPELEALLTEKCSVPA